jgi:hypothetical protein
MTDFLKDCYFNGFYKGRKNFVPTLRYANKLRAMQHSIAIKIQMLKSNLKSKFRFRHRNCDEIRMKFRRNFETEGSISKSKFREIETSKFRRNYDKIFVGIWIVEKQTNDFRGNPIVGLRRLLCVKNLHISSQQGLWNVKWFLTHLHEIKNLS